MNPRINIAAATLGALALTAMASAPALAATVISQADATALTLSIAGSSESSGTVTATNDGSGEVVTGETNPPIAVLGNQNLLDIGVLAQEAQALVQNGQGVSAACSGVAGDGATLVEVGESECLIPGDPVGITIENLDLTGSILIDPESALGAFAALQPVVDQLVGPLTQAISDGLEPLGATGLSGTLGAVQARCTAGPDGALTGTANIADTKLQLDVAGNSTNPVELPVNPPPNTKVITGLDTVLNTVIDAIRVDLNNTLDAQLAPLQALIDPIQDQIVNELIAQIAPQLAPLEDNVLDITLNRQTRTEDSIEVTALVLKVLPAAGDPVLGAEIARVSCGPNGRLAPDNPDNPDKPDNPNNPENPGNPGNPGNPSNPTVPTFVDAGAGTADQTTLVGGALGGALVLLTGMAGLLGYRRFSVH